MNKEVSYKNVVIIEQSTNKKNYVYSIFYNGKLCSTKAGNHIEQDDLMKLAIKVQREKEVQ